MLSSFHRNNRQCCFVITSSRQQCTLTGKYCTFHEGELHSCGCVPALCAQHSSLSSHTVVYACATVSFFFFYCLRCTLRVFIFTFRLLFPVHFRLFVCITVSLRARIHVSRFCVRLCPCVGERVNEGER